MWDLWWTKRHWDRFFPPVLRFSPDNFIPTVLHYTEKRKKLIIFITGLHNKPQGCGASVASAAGPFTTKQTKRVCKFQWVNIGTQNKLGVIPDCQFFFLNMTSYAYFCLFPHFILFVSFMFSACVFLVLFIVVRFYVLTEVTKQRAPSV
jgi:hypothetical protein